MEEFRPRIIVYYLPQYHPTPDNDKWWGKGFTEWTNVGKAKPLFRGHYQPKVPADLGYYDLRLPEVRAAQVELAKEAGIDGFCYYHYWFGGGKQELELPFNEVLRTGEPDFPFCLCWANEPWHAKFWNMDGTVSKRTLIDQQYGNEEEWKLHFEHVLPAFKDKRYIKIQNKPVFVIYKEQDFEEVDKFITYWNDLALRNGFDGIYFIAQRSSGLDDSLVSRVVQKGFDAVNTVGLWVARERNRSFLTKCMDKFRQLVLKLPNVYSYARMYPSFLSDIDRLENVYPTLIPNWDHTPRSGAAGYVLTGSTPQLFSEHIRQVFSVVEKKSPEHQIVFLKSWNEWGEGNYMEPDLKFGKEYIKALRAELDKYKAKYNR